MEEAKEVEVVEAFVRKEEGRVDEAGFEDIKSEGERREEEDEKEGEGCGGREEVL